MRLNSTSFFFFHTIATIMVNDESSFAPRDTVMTWMETAIAGLCFSVSLSDNFTLMWSKAWHTLEEFGLKMFYLKEHLFNFLIVSQIDICFWLQQKDVFSPNEFLIVYVIIVWETRLTAKWNVKKQTKFSNDIHQATENFHRYVCMNVH